MVSALVLLLAAGCPKPAPVPPAADPLSFDDDAPEAGHSDDPDAPRSSVTDPEGCRAGGTEWAGKHEGCLYEVEGCCYPSPGAACAAAGCPKGCQILESAPAQIRCRAS